MQNRDTVPYVRADGGKAVTSEGGIQLLAPHAPHPRQSSSDCKCTQKNSATPQSHAHLS